MFRSLHPINYFDAWSYNRDGLRSVDNAAMKTVTSRGQTTRAWSLALRLGSEDAEQKVSPQPIPCVRRRFAVNAE